jgi:hypothetical protein
MVIRIAAKVAGKGRKRIVKYVRKEKTFTFPRIRAPINVGEMKRSF